MVRSRDVLAAERRDRRDLLVSVVAAAVLALGLAAVAQERALPAVESDRSIGEQRAARPVERGLPLNHLAGTQGEGRYGARRRRRDAASARQGRAWQHINGRIV